MKTSDKLRKAFNNFLIGHKTATADFLSALEEV